MKEDRDPSFEQSELIELVERFEKMMRENARYFFDVDEFEEIMDYYLDSGKFKAAFAVLDIAKSQHPYSLDFSLREAELLAITNQPEKAMTVLSRVEYLEGGNPDFYLTRASVQSQLGHYSKAISNLQEAIRHTDHPADKDNIYMSLAFEYQNLDNIEQAIFYLKQSLQNNPSNEDALYELVYCFDQLHQAEAGIAYFQEFVDNNPYSLHGWYNLGNLYLQFDLLEKGISAYDFALVIDDSFPAAHFNKAGALSRLERYEDAIEAYQHTLAINSADAITHYYIGESYEKLEDYPTAHQYYQNAVKHDPYLADAWLGIGVMLDYQNRLTEGIHYIKKAIGLDQENAEYWFVLGEVERKLGFIEDAKFAFEKVIHFDSSNTDIWLDYADMLYEQNNLEGAIEVVDRGLKHHTQDSNLFYRLTAFHLLQGRETEALDALRSGLQLDAENHHELFEYFPLSRKNIRVLDLIETYKKQ